MVIASDCGTSALLFHAVYIWDNDLVRLAMCWQVDRTSVLWCESAEFMFLWIHSWSSLRRVFPGNWLCWCLRSDALKMKTAQKHVEHTNITTTQTKWSWYNSKNTQKATSVNLNLQSLRTADDCMHVVVHNLASALSSLSFRLFTPKVRR